MKNLEDDEEQVQDEFSLNTSLLFDYSEKFSNKLTFSKYNMKRTANLSTAAQDDYKGDRKALSYLGTYNFNLDSSITIGADTSFETANYKSNTSFLKEGATVNSLYADYQKRLTPNLYVTAGGRQEDHSVAGQENAYRTSVAHLSDDKTLKLKGSYGTAFRFPSLYEMYFVYGSHQKVRDTIKAETSKGFDIGFEKALPDLNLDFDVTYFKTKYFDALEGWSGNTAYAQWGNTTNSTSTTRAEGIEFISKWKTNDNLNFGLNYTYTSTYDGAENDNPDRLTDNDHSQMVRVPQHFLNLITSYKIPETNLGLTLRTKVSSRASDYGNENRPYHDVFKNIHLGGYAVHDLSLNYDLFGQYDVYADLNNILDQRYETALDYSSQERSVNFGIKRSY